MKTIPNFSRYAADTQGNIYSLNYKRTGLVKQIRPCIRQGYLQSMFQRDDKKYCTEKVHKLVTLAFFGERPAGTEVNHINGIKTDNRIENLEYVSHSENCLHSFRTKLQKPKAGALNGMSKLTDKQVAEIRNFVAASKQRFYGRKKLALKYGISEAHVKDIVSRRRNVWSHI
jgi:hypothetical protein